MQQQCIWNDNYFRNYQRQVKSSHSLLMQCERQLHIGPLWQTIISGVEG